MPTSACACGAPWTAEHRCSAVPSCTDIREQNKLARKEKARRKKEGQDECNIRLNHKVVRKAAAAVITRVQEGQSHGPR